jgi:single-strand DNA-binding protein
MAQSLNKHMLIGYVGQDPRVSSYNDRKVAQFTLATSETFKDHDDNKKKQTDWHNIVAWSPVAEIVEQFVKKGSRIYVEGKSRTRSYQTQNGETRYITEVLAGTVILLDRKLNEGGDRMPPAPAPQTQQQRQPQNQGAAPQYQQRQTQEQPQPQAGDYADGLGLESDDMPAF